MGCLLRSFNDAAGVDLLSSSFDLFCSIYFAVVTVRPSIQPNKNWPKKNIIFKPLFLKGPVWINVVIFAFIFTFTLA